MPKVKVYKQNGEDAGTLALNDAVFGAPLNAPLIHSVTVAQRNNARQGTFANLTRAEVRGGGIKPWRQKHTGRARQGSIRSPQWEGGGIVFAKKPRDFSVKVNKTAKKQALLSALSAKAASGELIVVEDVKLKSPKTKEVYKILRALKAEKTVLLVLPERDEAVIRAARNLPGVTTTFAALINVYDLAANEKCLITKEAVKKIEEAYAK